MTRWCDGSVFSSCVRFPRGSNHILYNWYLLLSTQHALRSECKDELAWSIVDRSQDNLFKWSQWITLGLLLKSTFISFDF